MAARTTDGAFVRSRFTLTTISGSRIPMASSITIFDTQLKWRELNAAREVAKGRISAPEEGGGGGGGRRGGGGGGRGRGGGRRGKIR